MSNANVQPLTDCNTTSSAKKAKALYWLGDDLRLADNAILSDISQNAQQLMLVYCIEPQWFAKAQYQAQYLGKHRLKFLLESLQALDEALSQYGQQLHIMYGQAQQCLPYLINTHDITRVYRSDHGGADERAKWQAIKQQCDSNTEFTTFTTQTLFSSQQLPFELDELPPSFSQFRKLVNNSHFEAVKDEVTWLPPMVALKSQDKLIQKWVTYPDWLPQTHMLSNVFSGGELQGKLQLESYFASNLAHSYKIVRNELAGWEHSTKFSPWLANGCLSARQVLSGLHEFESQHGANESSRWIEYELLWREYFHWYAHKFNNKLFWFAGITGKKPLTSFYAKRLQSWKTATTPYPLVNALMTQLNQTGYMSNRGRQIVASCLIHELQCDWRYGAAYFQQQLIDYDVAINWGNWQYLAGVGADPRGSRRFNLAKQQQIFDPQGQFIKAWLGSVALQQNSIQLVSELDGVDMADWPC
ncbi:DASH family cryptochrome [Shewanella inventionis]|uniref:DASH family cryptochrome n=1 Tax=Shewanella inventionis TaxID=1738770 RepID=UPI001CBEFE76|nr:DASH family cryptochrome [Shewanella inventionis]UAL44632.1 DASH family cryptochrome [Shewanella inventionis]